MGMSSERYIVMILILDLIIVMAIVLMNGTNNNAQEEALEYTDGLRSWKNAFRTNFPNTGVESAAQQYERTYGDTKYGGGSIFGMMDGLPDNPIETNCENGRCNNNNSAYRWINWGFIMLVSLLNVLMVYQIYLIVVNRKT